MKATLLTALGSLLIAPVAQAQCVGDVAVDARVDGGDLGVLLANWGPVTSTALSRACDFDSNSQIDGADLGALLANWGACPAPTWGTVLEAQPDPAVVTDASLRAAIQAAGLPWRVRDNGTGIEMLLVPPGTFQMGCIMGSTQYGCWNDELPVHQVTLMNAFYLGRYEVTQAQWVAKMGSNPSFFQGHPNSPNRPVEQVSWNTVQGYLSATGFRLPTEAEWEYACRAGTLTPFYNGSTDDSAVGTLAWYGSCCGGNSGGQTHPVGGKLSNAFGLYDMLGNVSEWVGDWKASYESTAQTDPQGPANGSARAYRGGHWSGFTGNVRSSNRGSELPGIPSGVIGFRVARTP
jgi:formylglycine-generating enzyme required for sulfatase activity